MIKVLVADDDKLLRRVFKLLLEREGFKVDAVGDGFQALKFVKNNPAYHLLITDVNMPGMSGLTLSKKAKKLSPEMKIIGISGNGLGPEDAKEHFDYFISKPFDVDELISGINKVLNQSSLYLKTA